MAVGSEEEFWKGKSVLTYSVEPVVRLGNSVTLRMDFTI